MIIIQIWRRRTIRNELTIFENDINRLWSLLSWGCFFLTTGKILTLSNLINISPNVPVDPRASVVMAIDCSFELIYFLAWHDNFRLFSSSDWCVCCDCPFAFQTQLGFVVEEPRIFENYFHLYLSVKKVSYDDLFSQSWLDFLFVEANKYNIILIKGLKKGLIISMKYYQENTFRK